MPHDVSGGVPQQQNIFRAPAPRHRGSSYSIGRAIGRVVHRHPPPRNLFAGHSRPRPKPRRLSPQQRNAKRIVKVSKALHAPHPVQLSALATALVESQLRNTRAHTRWNQDSLGLFQQRPSQGWGTPAQIMTPSYAAWRYLTAAKQAYRPGMDLGVLAQTVQRSGYPDKYGKALSHARRIERGLG